MGGVFDNFWDQALDDVAVGTGQIKAGLAGLLGAAGGKDDQVGAG